MKRTYSTKEELCKARRNWNTGSTKAERICRENPCRIIPVLPLQHFITVKNKYEKVSQILTEICRNLCKFEKKFNVMAKWADFLISGIWEDANRVITHVMIHVDFGDTVGNGRKVTRNTIIELIKRGNRIKTIRWLYESAMWGEGADVITVTLSNGTKYIRTEPDAEIHDNLDNSFPYGNNTY